MFLAINVMTEKRKEEKRCLQGEHLKGQVRVIQMNFIGSQHLNTIVSNALFFTLKYQVFFTGLKYIFESISGLTYGVPSVSGRR